EARLAVARGRGLRPDDGRVGNVRMKTHPANVRSRDARRAGLLFRPPRRSVGQGANPAQRRRTHVESVGAVRCFYESARARTRGAPARTSAAPRLLPDLGGVLVVIRVEALLRDAHDDEPVALELRLTAEP